MRYKEVIDKDVRESRIVDNLNTWEISMTKYPNIKYNPSVAKMIKTVYILLIFMFVIYN